MPKNPKNGNKTISGQTFPVIGIGASAGGLEAYKYLLKAIPPDSGMAYILVQHLHPEHSSSLPEILQRETPVPVQEISDNVKVEPDNIYVKKNFFLMNSNKFFDMISNKNLSLNWFETPKNNQ